MRRVLTAAILATLATTCVRSAVAEGDDSPAPSPSAAIRTDAPSAGGTKGRSPRKKAKRSAPAPSRNAIQSAGQGTTDRTPAQSGEIARADVAQVPATPEPEALPPAVPERGSPARSDGACDSASGGCSQNSGTTFTAGAELDLDSRLIWRGLALSSGPILQPTAWASAYRFQAIVWTSLLLVDEPPHRRVRSVVPSISYTYSWDRFKVESGVLFYWIGDEIAPRTTAEAYLTGDVAFGNVHLVSENYVDVKDYPGAYFGSIGPQIELSRDPWTFKGTLDLGFATADFNNAYFGVNGPALNVAEAGLEARWDVTEHLYATVHGEGSMLLAPGLWRSVNEPALFCVGTAFGAEL